MLETTTGSPYPFGVSTHPAGYNFSIYAKDAEEVSLCLFEEDQTEPFQEVLLDPHSNRTGDVWHTSLSTLPPYTVYAYRVKKSDGTSVLLLDPYAKTVASEHHWRENENEERPYRPLGKIALPHSFDWEGDTLPNHAAKDLIIYEMHVRGFTQHHSSQVKHPGTYAGLTEKIPYLQSLGINAVELLPVHEFNEREALQTNPRTKQKLCNYFGYSTVNFFSPMNRYAADSRQGNVLTEFKTMVKEFHKHKIEVILDVVFNHTFEGNQQGPTTSFRGFDPLAYYMIDEHGNYLNFSGCGNTLNCNHPITRELILEALRYWVVEMHIDGFRFDLASIMTRSENGTPLINPPLVEAITKDPILSQTKLIAEAWDAGGLYQVGGFVPGSKRWGEWNGKYRDVVRRFIKGTCGYKNAFATAICGSQDLYGYGRSPSCSVNFVTAHDGFSLADLVCYDGKHNEENGEENRDGFDHNDSWNCGFEGHSSNQKVVKLRDRQIRNFHLALMVSQGIPMILMGDEYAHSRHGNNNTWCQDNELNWFLWDRLDIRTGFHRFFRLLIQFRNNYPLLRREDFLTDQDIQWHGLAPLDPQWENDNRFVAFTLNLPEQGPDLYVAFNTSHLPLTITFPSLPEGKSWYWVVNTHNSSPTDFYEDGHLPKVEARTYRIHSYTSIMLRAFPS